MRPLVAVGSDLADDGAAWADSPLAVGSWCSMRRPPSGRRRSPVLDDAERDRLSPSRWRGSEGHLGCPTGEHRRSELFYGRDRHRDTVGIERARRCEDGELLEPDPHARLGRRRRRTPSGIRTSTRRSTGNAAAGPGCRTRRNGRRRDAGSGCAPRGATPSRRAPPPFPESPGRSGGSRASSGSPARGIGNISEVQQ